MATMFGLTKKSIIYFFVLLLILQMPSLSEAAQKEQEQGIIVLCYHEVGDFKSPARTPYDLDTKHLAEHLKFFQKEGYTFISLDDYIAINKGEKALPPKAIMLTFDDGYLSFYTTIYPLLKKYDAPAMMAIIGSWMEDNASGDVKMSSWKQFREMEDSGLVTVVSHTYDLHKPVLINEYGENSPAIGGRLYKGAGLYETEAAYRERVAYDLAKAQKQFEENMGHKSKALVWPFGAHNDSALELAKEAGFEATFILHDGINPVDESSIERARRMIVYNNPSGGKIKDFINAHLKKDNQPFRLATIKLSDVYDPSDMEQTDANIDTLVTRLIYSNTWRVALETAEDTDGDGFVDKVYYHNEKAPILVDIFNHVAGRLEAEGIRVYAKVSVFNNKWLWTDEDVDIQKEKILFDKETRENLVRAIEDLAIFSPISGIYFNEDLLLTRDDLQGAYAQKAYEEKFSRPFSPQVLNDEELKSEWENWRIDSIVALTSELSAAVKAHRPEARSIRVITEDAIIDTAIAKASAQDYRKFIESNDYVMIRIQEKPDDDFATIKKRLVNVADEAVMVESAREQVVFGIPSYYEKEQRWFKARETLAFSNVIAKKGIKYFAYFPETLMYDDLWYFPNVNVKPF